MEGLIKILHNKETNSFEAYMPNGEMIPAQMRVSITDDYEWNRHGIPGRFIATIQVVCDISSLGTQPKPGRYMEVAPGYHVSIDDEADTP